MTTVNRIKKIISMIFHRRHSQPISAPTITHAAGTVSTANPFDEIQQNPDEYGCPI